MTISTHAVVACCGIAFASAALAQTSGVNEAKTFTKTITVEAKLDYLFYLPAGHKANSSEKWPLIFFLHGAGERGGDVQQVKVHGIPKIAEQQEDFPFIAVSPQCPTGSWWTSQLPALNGLLDEIVENYAVDEERIYLTGLSMGRYGTWAWATERPDRFAAIAPICGGGDATKATAIKGIPAWVSHGAKDPVVSPTQSAEMVGALKALGGDVRFTLYPETDHDSWTETYDNPDLYRWFLSHSKTP